MKHSNLFLTASLVLLLASTSQAEAPWTEPYFQYRLPVTIESKAAGWHRVPVDEYTITAAVNRRQMMKFDPWFFAYNYVRVVAVDEHGKKIKEVTDAGFYLTELEREVADEVLKVKADSATINVEPSKFHMLHYTSSDGGKCPALYYETIFPPGSRMRRTNYRVSYFPPLLPLQAKDHEVLFVPDRKKMKLLIRGRFIGKIHRLYVRRAEIQFQAKLDRPGKHRWLVYYQPMCSHHLQIPKKRRTKLVKRQAKLVSLGGAARYFGATRYRLASNNNWQVDFAASTVKVIADEPHIRLPQRKAIRLTAASNESESFQIVTRSPKKLTIKQVKVRGLKFPVDVRRVAYVPVKRSSYITPARYVGRIGDPLVPVRLPLNVPANETLAVWFTVHVPPGQRAGEYKGNCVLESNQGEVSIPLVVKVFDFQLPHLSAFKANMGGQYIVKRLASGDAKRVLDYHGLSTEDDARKLSRGYYDAMVANKFAPKNVGMFADINYQWSPPPKGYNVDAPGNLFKLGKFDLTNLNLELKHHDKGGLNSFCLVHTNPTRSHIFVHLPGERLEKMARSSPHTVLGWQTLRKMKYVGYGINGKGPFHKEAIEITQKQWDHLVLNFYRRMAKNLQNQGWLERTHLLVDETENATRLAHLLRLLKSDPLTAKIQTVACIQGLGLLNHREKGRKEYTFHKILDTYCPEIDENYDRWMPYYFSDYKLSGRRRLWCYLVTSSRLAIDAPGINNRMIALDVFNRGGSGLLIWETFGWHHLYGGSQNPWKDPYTRHANGSLAYFYPPSREGLSKRRDFTITPSLRLLTFRESVEDYDYAYMLEQLVAKAERHGKNVAKAKTVLADVGRFFASNTHWSQNDAWYLGLRKRMAREIEVLRSRVD